MDGAVTKSRTRSISLGTFDGNDHLRHVGDSDSTSNALDLCSQCAPVAPGYSQPLSNLGTAAAPLGIADQVAQAQATAAAQVIGLHQAAGPFEMGAGSLLAPPSPQALLPQQQAAVAAMQAQHVAPYPYLDVKLLQAATGQSESIRAAEQPGGLNLSAPGGGIYMPQPQAPQGGAPDAGGKVRIKAAPKAKDGDAAVAAGVGGAGARRSQTSSYRGVTFHKRTGRFEAHLWASGKQMYLGGFDSESKAATAYDFMALKCRGDAAHLNFSRDAYTADAAWLKKVTCEELMLSLRRHSKGFSRGTSKYRGVSLNPNGKWEARCSEGGRKYSYLGLFSSEAEAARAYDRMCVRRNGASAVTNFGLSQYSEELKEHEKNKLRVMRETKNGGGAGSASGSRQKGAKRKGGAGAVNDDDYVPSTSTVSKNKAIRRDTTGGREAEVEPVSTPEKPPPATAAPTPHMCSAAALLSQSIAPSPPHPAPLEKQPAALLPAAIPASPPLAARALELQHPPTGPGGQPPALELRHLPAGPGGPPPVP